jgi:hypothetical protein
MSDEDLKEALKYRTGRVVVCRTRSQAISNDAQSAAAIAAAERAERAAGGGYSALLFTPEYTRNMLESGQQDRAETEMTISVEKVRELLSHGAEWNDLEF